MLVFVFHIAAGVIALGSGVVAAVARKGGPLHRTAGTVFVVSMLIMATFAAWLAVTIPGQMVNLIIAVFTLYLVTTAWMTVRRKAGAIGAAERIGLAVSLCLCAPFVVLSFQLATGLTPIFTTAIPFKGPVLVAIYGFTLVIVSAAVADARVVLAGGIGGAPRIARHLWRMCLGLTLAAGSGFTNGVARLLPGPYHVPAALFLPQFLPLLLMIYWLVRVRFPGWAKTRGVGLTTPLSGAIAPQK